MKQFVLFLTALLLVSCAGRKDEVHVFAAASLTDVMAEIKDLYEQDHKDRIILNLAGSKTLRAQIENGARSDLFLSANGRHYEALKEKGMTMRGDAFLGNSMVLALSGKSPVILDSMEDLARPCKLVLAEENVPAGDYARTIISSLNGLYGEDYETGVTENIVSVESNIRLVLTKVVLGEADCALVYRTDIGPDTAEKLRLVEIPEGYNIEARYFKALIREGGSEFYDFLTGEEAGKIFERYGFQFL